MGAQVGILSAFQLGQHDHLSAERGGLLHAYSRYGAFRTPYRTGALIVHCDNDVENSYAGIGFDAVKETLINVAQPGRYRISWRMKNFDNVTAVHARVAINDVDIPASDQANATDVYVGKTYNYDVDLAAGDRVQIVGDPVGDRVFIDEFRIYYDWGIAYFGDGTFNNLVTLLPLSDAELLDFAVVL